MSKSALNRTLQRPLLDGSMYNAFFSTSKCIPTPLGDGDTEFTINQMKDQVLKWAKELDTKKVKKLFAKPTLLATVTNIHNFEYNHYQYNADGWNQNLRSPKCAWASRSVGIDCKSYAITASCLLLNLNIKHYIRRIKQPFHDYPNEYTHVYVNVPFDQVNGDLSKGYYTIDGTLSTMEEPLNTNPHDIFMSTKMPHYALNGSGITDGTNSDALGDIWGSISEGASGSDGWLSNIDLGEAFGSITSIFGGGGSCPYGATQLTTDLENINNVTQQTIQTALSPELSDTEKETILTDLYFNVTQYVLGVQAANASNSCTHQATAMLVDNTINNYLPVVFAALKQNLAANGITMIIQDHNGTKKVYLNVSNASGIPNTSTGTGTTANTNQQQQIDAGNGKSKTAGMGVFGLLMLAAAAGLGVNEYQKSQAKKAADKKNAK